MKHYLTSLLLFSVLFVACKKAEQPEAPVTKPNPPVNPGVKASSKTFKIDSIKALVQKNGAYTSLSDSVWADSTGISFRVQMQDDFSDGGFSFTAKNNESIYPGALIQSSTIGDLSYKPLTGYKQNPLVIFSSSPSFDPFMTKMVPSLSGTTDFIKTSLKANAKQINSFSYSNGDEFKNYGEISMATRKNWDFSNLVIRKPGDKGRIKKKTGFYVTYDLALFNISVDWPASGGKLFDASIDAKLIAVNTVYVNDVTYGRTAIIAIESDASFQQIKSAFQNVQKGQESADDRKLLQEATITVHMRGFKDTDISSIQAAQGYDCVSLFTKALTAGGTYSATDYGAPIRFYLGNIVDNSNVKPKFKYRLDYTI